VGERVEPPGGRPAPSGRDPLTILQLCTYDRGGGAENVARSLFEAYRGRGYGATLIVGRKLGDDPDVRELSGDAPPGRWAGLRARIHRRLGWEHFGFPATWRLPALVPSGPTVLHAHNLHGGFLPGGGYFDLRALPWLSSRFPVFLTLHDAWLLSGHCAHSLDCERWRTGCGACPYLDLYPAVRRDATARNFRRKRRIYRKASLYVATPSRWLMQRLDASMLRPAVREARVIPNGIDLSVFRPGDRDAAREELGLPRTGTVLLSVANSLATNPWKDYACLRRAVGLAAERLADREVVFVVLGDTVPDVALGKARVVSLPFIGDPRRVARVYRAADLYLHAARAETFPTTVLEALACGIPVAGTAVGGIAEQVQGLAFDPAAGTLTGGVAGRESASGVLVPEGDAEALAAAAVALLGDPELLRTLGANGALDARRRFGFDAQVEAYLDWYHEVAIDWERRRSLPTNA
jgi:glycosyltransferase involved in cell wall biosynthesis